MKIVELVYTAHYDSRLKGWYEPPPTPVEQIALAHSELSEALEAYRERGLESWTRDDGKPEGVASELADTVIRICDMAGNLGIDLQQAIVDKLAFNRTRPHRHGGKRL